MKVGGGAHLNLIAAVALLFQSSWCVSVIPVALQSPLERIERFSIKYPSTISAESACWALEQNLGDQHALTHSLFRDVASHLRSSTSPDGSRSSCLPFLIRRDADADTPINEFTCDDLESAVACDYLVASTGRNSISNTEQGGWRMDDLGSSGSQSFQSKRLDWKSVLNSQNTVVFNSAGAYISSKLAPTALAALHGLSGAAAGVCLNLYVTKADIRQSAPPHTDKQDVVVVQTQGRKRWRVFSPPDCAMKYNVDPFCRGKGGDELTVPMLSNEGSELLLDVMLSPGDILFVPARFPHTTDTLDCYNEDIGGDWGASKERIFGKEDWSMHLTVGLDSHVWAMNSMSMRTLALRRFGIHDVLKGTDYNTDPDRNMDHCVGKVNQLSVDLREGLFSSLDETLFFPQHQRHQHPHGQILEQNIARVATNLLAFHERTNFECSWVDVDNILTLDQCVKTVMQFSAIGQKIMNAHEDMYIAALEEETRRGSEEGGWARHVGYRMANERVDRLSIFRVPVYFEQLDKLREELRTWGDYRGDQDGGSRAGIEALRVPAPLPFLVNGDQVTANLGIGDKTQVLAWSPANVLEVRSDGLFNLVLFDGTVKEGVERSAINGPHGIGIFI